MPVHIIYHKCNCASNFTLCALNDLLLWLPMRMLYLCFVLSFSRTLPSQGYGTAQSKNHSRIFTGLHGIRPSVCLSNAWFVTKWKLCPHLYTTWKTIYPSFVRTKMVGGATPSTWNFGSTGPRWSEIADFQPIFARSASATLIGSPLRAFQWA